MITNYNNYNDEVKAYVLELLELCLDFGFTFEYMQSIKGVVIWQQTGAIAEECKILGRCYLDSPDAVTKLIKLIISVKAHARMQEVIHDLVS